MKAGSQASRDEIARRELCLRLANEHQGSAREVVLRAEAYVAFIEGREPPPSSAAQNDQPQYIWWGDQHLTAHQWRRGVEADARRLKGYTFDGVAISPLVWDAFRYGSPRLTSWQEVEKEGAAGLLRRENFGKGALVEVMLRLQELGKLNEFRISEKDRE